MLLSVFRANYLIISLILALFISLLWIIPLTTDLDFSGNPDGINGQTGAFNLLLNTRLALGLMACIAQAFLLNVMFNTAGLLSRRTSLPGLIFVIVKIISPDGFLFWSYDLVLILLLVGLIPLNKMKREASALEMCFVFGVIAGLCGLLYVPALLLMTIPWIYLLQIRPFEWREYFAPFLGAILVFVVLLTYQLFATDGGISTKLYQGHFRHFPQVTPKEIGLLVLISSTILTLLGFRYLFKAASNATVYFKKLSRSISFQMFFVLVWSLGLVEFGMGHFGTMFFAFAASLLLPFYLQEPRRPRLQNFLFYSWFAIIISQHYFSSLS